MDFLNIFLQKFLEFVMPFLALALFGLLVSLARKAWVEVKEHRPDVAFALEEAARMAVMAAEQSNLAGLVKEKKAFALKIAEDYLALKGIKVDLHLIDAAVEAAVFEEINKQKRVTP